MTEKTWHPLSFCNPYTSKQYETFRQAYIYAVRRKYTEPEALEFFNARWPEIRAAAHLCDRELSIWRHLNDKTKWNHRKDGEPSESETERARIRSLRANRFRNVRRAATSSGGGRQFIEKHPEQVDVLLYGALRAGIIEPIVGRDDYSKEIAQLRQITPDQLKVAVAAASEKGSALVDDKARPSTAPVNIYVQFLIEVLFSHVTSTPSGPAAVWTFEAALAPFQLSLTESGVRRLVRRAGSARRQ